MAKVELLNHQNHGHLRLRKAPEDVPHFVQIFASEFSVAAACCPVLFTKDPGTGEFYAGAVFGFKPGENLVGGLDERGGYIPLVLQREGFFLAERNVAIDSEHARFSDTEGEPLFNAAREPGDSLRVIQRVLGEIHTGMEQLKSFVAALVELKLIEPIEVSLAFPDGERVSLQGLYTVSLDRLRALDDAAALQLFRSGHLQLAYIMAASLKQIPRLARRRMRAKP